MACECFPLLLCAGAESLAGPAQGPGLRLLGTGAPAAQALCASLVDLVAFEVGLEATACHDQLYELLPQQAWLMGPVCRSTLVDSCGNGTTCAKCSKQSGPHTAASGVDVGHWSSADSAPWINYYEIIFAVLRVAERCAELQGCTWWILHLQVFHKTVMHGTCAAGTYVNCARLICMISNSCIDFLLRAGSGVC